MPTEIQIVFVAKEVEEKLSRCLHRRRGNKVTMGRSTSYGARMREYSYYQARRAEREKFVAVQCTRARFDRRIRWLTRNGINRLNLLLFSFERELQS